MQVNNYLKVTYLKTAATPPRIYLFDSRDRASVNAALRTARDEHPDLKPVLSFSVWERCPGVPSDVLEIGEPMIGGLGDGG